MRVTFQPNNRATSAVRGDTLLDAALANGIPIAHDCGGNCACTTCRVEILEGDSALSSMEPVEQDRLSTEADITARSRLACQVILLGGDAEAAICYPE